MKIRTAVASRSVRAAFALALCAGLFCVYACLAHTQEGGQPVQDQPSAQSVSMLYERDVADFERMEVTLRTGEAYALLSDLVFDAQGKLLGVQNNLGQPVLMEGHEGFALSSGAYQMALLCAQHLPVTGRIEQADRAACELVNPHARITLEYAQGECLQLSLGARTPTGEGCYVALEGDEAVYIVPADFYAVFTSKPNALHRLPGFDAQDAADAQQIAVGRGEDVILVRRRTQAEMQGAVLSWVAERPYTHDVNTAQVKSLAQSICALRADAYVDSVTESEALARYGLLEPTYVALALSDGTLLEAFIGADAGEGMTYARFGRSGDVYRVQNERLAFLKEATLDGLLERYIALIPASDVKAVRVIAPNLEAELTLEWGEESTAYAQRYMLGEREVPLEDFSALYAAIVGICFDKTDLQSVKAGEMLSRVEFTHLDGRTTTLAYQAADMHYALVHVNGQARFLTRKERVEAMTDALMKALSDQAKEEKTNAYE